MSGSVDRDGSDPRRGRCLTVLPLSETSYSHYAPKLCGRSLMCRSSSMTVLLEEGYSQQSPTSNGASPSPCTPSPHPPLGPELRIIVDSIGDDHVPLISGLRDMKHLGKSMDKVSLCVCVCVCVCDVQ